jgi:hypothetical protein
MVVGMSRARDSLLAVLAGLMLLGSHALHGWPGREVREVLAPPSTFGSAPLERFLAGVDRRVPRHDEVLVWYRSRPAEWDAPLHRWQAQRSWSPRPDPGATFARYYLGPRPVAVLDLEQDARAGELVRSASWLVAWGEAASPHPPGWQAVFSEAEGTLYRRP